MTTLADPSPFLFRHDWAEPFKITREFATDVQTSHDGSETRVQLRDDANLRVQMRCVFLNEIGAGRLLATWRSATTPLRYWAPLWCDASDLTSAVTAGDETIFCDLTDRPFLQQAPGHVMLYREPPFGPVVAEVVSVSGYAEGQLTASATDNDYPQAGTRVVPVRAMWLKMPQRVTWESEKITNLSLEFFDQKDQAGYELDDDDTTDAADSITIYGFTAGTSFVEAVVKDATGLPIEYATVTWEVASGSATIIPSLNTRFARVEDAGISAVLRATCGSATATTS